MPDVHALAAAAERLLSPAAPAIVRRLGERRPDLEALRRDLDVDPVLTVRIIDHANHSYYAARAPVADLRRALVRLGWEAAARLLLRLTVQAGHAPADATERAWEAALAIGLGARDLARRSGTLDGGLAYTAGLTHNLGVLGLLAVYGEREAEQVRATDSGPALARAERAALGTHHAAVGEALLARWHLPEPVSGAVRHQYRPRLDEASWTGRADRALAAVLQIAHRLRATATPSSCPLTARLGLDAADLTDVLDAMQTTGARELREAS